jgi:hypothetical protein
LEVEPVQDQLPNDVYDLMHREVGPTPNTDPVLLKEIGTGKVQERRPAPDAAQAAGASLKKRRRTTTGKDDIVAAMRSFREDMQQLNAVLAAQDAAEQERERARDAANNRMLLILEKMADAAGRGK